MKAQHALGLKLSWSRVTVVFLLDVAILALASHWPGDVRYATHAWWSGVGVAALLTVVALITYHRVPLSSVLSARVVDRFADPDAMLAEGRTPAVDHRRRYSRELVGVREYQDRLVALIAVDERAATPSGRHHRGAAANVTLPVELVAAGLRQFDVHLDNIDIVSVGERGADDGVDGAPESRRTWLVLRMDPQRNVAAVASRDSVAATLAAAAERLTHDLAGRHISARVLTAGEFDEVDTAVLAGLEPAYVRARRWQLKPEQPRQYVASFWVTPRDIISENLEQLWLPEADVTVVTVRLTPRRGRTEVSVLVRHQGDSRLPKGVRAELNRLPGRWLAAVCTSLPVPLRQRALPVPARELADGEHLVVGLNSAAPPAMAREVAAQ